MISPHLSRNLIIRWHLVTAAPVIAIQWGMKWIIILVFQVLQIMRKSMIIMLWIQGVDIHCLHISTHFKLVIYSNMSVQWANCRQKMYASIFLYCVLHKHVSALGRHTSHYIYTLGMHHSSITTWVQRSTLSASMPTTVVTMLEVLLCSFEYASWSRNDSPLVQIRSSFFFIILLTNHTLKYADTFL